MQNKFWNSSVTLEDMKFEVWIFRDFGNTVSSPWRGRLSEMVTHKSLEHIGSKFASLAYCDWRDLPHVLNVLVEWKVNFESKKLVFPFEKFLSLILPRNVIILQDLIMQFVLYYVSIGRLRRVKNKENFKLFVLKVVAVACERWSHTRGSKYCDKT